MDNRAKQGGRAGPSACASSSRPLSMAPPKKHPNPLLFVGISALSFVAFYATLKYRSTHHPASAQPRQHDQPLVPPRHKDS